MKNGRVVKGRSFVNLRDAGDPVECGKQYSDAGADELVFLDITATLEARKTILELAARVAEEVFIPFTIGGGISTIEDARGLLSAGAEKISINTAAVRNKPLITEISEAFGNQAVVVAIDAKRTGGTGFQPVQAQPGKAVPPKWEVYINAGTTPTGIDVIQWAKEVESLGAGEIMLTSIDSDGHTAGYDIELNAAVSEAVSIPVIASGGAGGPEDMLRVLTEGKADAALAASIFHYETYSIAAVKDYLRSHGVHVRS